MDQKRTSQKQRKQARSHKLSQVQDPKNPASKPNATTQDQVANMESEGQAQQPGQEPPADIREELDSETRKGRKG